MFSISVILVLLFGHFYADFIQQNHWMAVNKSKNNRALSLHVAMYTLCMIFPFMYAFHNSINLDGYFYALLLVLYILFNGAMHFATDYITSRTNSKLWASGNIHNFFVGVGFDQFIHYATIFGSLYLIQVMV